MRACVVCGIDIGHRHGRAKVCSEACGYARDIEYNRRWIAHAKGREYDPTRYSSLRLKVACEVCGSDLSHRPKHSKTCSKECHAERMRAYFRSYHQTTKESRKEKRQKWFKQYALRNREKLNARLRQRRVDDPKFRLSEQDRRRRYSRENPEKERQKRAAYRKSAAGRAAIRRWRKREQEKIQVTLKALRQVGLLKGLPQQTASQRRTILSAAKQLQLI